MDSVSDSDITIALDLEIENGGAPILLYSLEINGGGLQDESFSEVAQIQPTSGSTTLALSVAGDGLTVG